MECDISREKGRQRRGQPPCRDGCSLPHRNQSKHSWVGIRGWKKRRERGWRRRKNFHREERAAEKRGGEWGSEGTTVVEKRT